MAEMVRLMAAPRGEMVMAMGKADFGVLMHFTQFCFSCRSL
jgi:hypothetical protein